MIFEEDIEKTGFISKDKILAYVSEEEIFEMIFNFKPKEFDYVTSPFRRDASPGCWFEYSLEGKLKFTDFGNTTVVNGIKMNNIDCFDAVQIFYKLPNFYQTLNYIKDNLILGKKVEKRNIELYPRLKEKKKVMIEIQTRNFDARDKNYWQQYGISKQNLIDDKVFPLKGYMMRNTKAGDVKFRTYDLCYAYTEFENLRKKLYRPYQKGPYRFITNCTVNDIGGIVHLPTEGDQLIITKSYKDFRVIANLGLYAIWFQNEGMVPSSDILEFLSSKFKNIIVFYDNDQTGITASLKISKILNEYTDSRPLWLPEALLEKGVTDPSDFYKKYGEELLIQFFKKEGLI